MNIMNTAQESLLQDQIQGLSPVRAKPLSLSRTCEAPFQDQRAGIAPRDDSLLQKCFVYSKDLADGDWFCRIPRPEGRIALCGPSCALHNFDTLHPPAGTDEQNVADYEHQAHFLLPGEKPWV